MSFTYPYARPAVTVDNIVVGRAKNGTEWILLIKRGREGTPFYGCWALPGGFVDENEDLEVAARRELREETHLEVGNMTQVGAFGKPGRDPRGHVIAVAFASAVFIADAYIEADDDAKEIGWWPLDALPPLAFDHADIIAAAKAQGAGHRFG
jgi:8-oxo-dGTP diphosphatase